MKKAWQIAKENLEACFKKRGIVASVDHFSDFWARDSFYACWGLLKIGEHQKVKENLRLFLEYQKENGHIPRRIDRFIVPLKYLGIKVKRRKLKPRYTGVYIYPALDANILFLITFYKYLKESSDIEFLNDNITGVLSAAGWLEKYEKGSLLQEGLFANWADIIIKKGKVLYTNILYAEALDDMSKMGEVLEKPKFQERFARRSEVVKEKINNNYWNNGYYIDWIYKKRSYDFFSTDGNVLAMLFDISGPDQNQKIIEYIEKYKLAKIPMKTNHPSYPAWRVKLIMRIVGAPGYQNNSTSWLWLGCIYAVALHKNGHKKRAQEIFGRISEKIKEYEKVYEIYGSDGIPFRGWYWRSASSFAWSSGLYLWMHENLFGNRTEQI